MKRAMLTLWLSGGLSWIAAGAEPAAEPSRPQAGSSLPAANPAEALPSVNQILASNVTAMGGPSALQRITSRMLKGTVDIPAMGVSQMPWEQWSKVPNKRLSRFKLAGVGDQIEGFDGAVLWSLGPDGKVVVKARDETARARRECEFNRELKFKEFYPQLTVRGRQKTGDADAYLVEAKPASGGIETFWFDAQSGLLVRWDSGAETESGKVEIRVYYKDHAVVDGLKLPHTLEIEINSTNRPPVRLTVRCNQIRNNVPIEDGKFKKPAD